ncbi:MFS general substrate transporter [Cristinia sonorae]|uniref:MFS general substrate transporter n=1 Tax=Cristinia sonorae TaxID=1940300 RepID=A0A8K0XTJ3_9AGAR|nr:MFS general substrate transporter [Cristinia sonorae]
MSVVKDDRSEPSSASVTSVEKGQQLQVPLNDAAAALQKYTPEQIRRTWRKVDSYIMPVSILLYLASYIDRTNIANAKVLGLFTDLKLSNNEYSLALSIFFIGYVLFETPSNILLKRFSPRWYIPTMTCIWGTVCACFAAVHNAKGLIVIRFFLGLAEAGFLPGIVFWLGCWYPRSMQGRRYALLYSSVSLTGAFGGLLATAIHSLDGAHGIAGWRWIFIVEGVITTGLGLLAYLVMSSYPADAHWLSAEERDIINLTNESDRALKAREGFSSAQIRSAFTDWRTYAWALMFLGTYIPVYSVVLSLPTVVSGLGYKGTTATLMACPPYGVGFFAVLISGWTVDRYGHLFYHYVAGIGVTIIALIVLMVVENLVARYVMFFFVMFMFVPISVMWAWLSSNVAGSNKRAAAQGFIFSTGNIGGAIGAQIYRAEFAPRYVQGHGINIALYALALASGTIVWWSYKRDNALRNAAASEQDQGLERPDMLGEDLGDLGDRHPRFRYLT